MDTEPKVHSLRFVNMQLTIKLRNREDMILKNWIKLMITYHRLYIQKR